MQDSGKWKERVRTNGEGKYTPFELEMTKKDYQAVVGRNDANLESNGSKPWDSILHNNRSMITSYDRWNFDEKHIPSDSMFLALENTTLKKGIFTTKGYVAASLRILREMSAAGVLVNCGKQIKKFLEDVMRHWGLADDEDDGIGQNILLSCTFDELGLNNIVVSRPTFPELQYPPWDSLLFKDETLHINFRKQNFGPVTITDKRVIELVKTLCEVEFKFLNLFCHQIDVRTLLDSSSLSVTLSSTMEIRQIVSALRFISESIASDFINGFFLMQTQKYVMLSSSYVKFTSTLPGIVASFLEFMCDGTLLFKVRNQKKLIFLIENEYPLFVLDHGQKGMISEESLRNELQKIYQQYREEKSLVECFEMTLKKFPTLKQRSKLSYLQVTPMRLFDFMELIFDSFRVYKDKKILGFATTSLKLRFDPTFIENTKTEVDMRNYMETTLQLRILDNVSLNGMYQDAVRKYGDKQVVSRLIHVKEAPQSFQRTQGDLPLLEPKSKSKHTKGDDSEYSSDDKWSSDESEEVEPCKHHVTRSRGQSAPKPAEEDTLSKNAPKPAEEDTKPAEEDMLMEEAVAAASGVRVKGGMRALQKKLKQKIGREATDTSKDDKVSEKDLDKLLNAIKDGEKTLAVYIKKLDELQNPQGAAEAPRRGKKTKLHDARDIEDMKEALQFSIVHLQDQIRSLQDEHTNKTVIHLRLNPHKYMDPR